jgi:nitroreductase
MTFARINPNVVPSPVAELAEQRYGGLEPSLQLIDDDVVGLLLAHRSVRAFSTQPLPVGLVDTLVAAAQSAATSSNLQTWSVVVVDDPDRRRALAEAAGGQAHVERCPLLLVWVADLHRNAAIADSHGEAKPALPYLETFLTAALDTALAAQNAVVAAESLGLGTVYVGALRNQPGRVAEILGLPERTLALFATCIGWPDARATGAIKPRLPQRIVVHRDVYQSVNAHGAVLDAYDKAFLDFQTRSKSSSRGPWTKRAAANLATVEALGGRDRLREEVLRRGLGLE